MIQEKTMNVYERIINILLEARVDMFIQDRLDEGNKAVRSFMKSRAGEMSSGSSSFTDPAIRAKKLDRAGKHRKEGNKKAARFELGQAKKLDKPDLP